MKEQYFTIQDRFLERMKADYEAGMITNPVYKPYFQWKLYGAPLSTFTSAVLSEMAEECSEELFDLDVKHPGAHDGHSTFPTLEDMWKPYAGYGEDKYLYAYLSAIDSEVTNLRMAVG